MYIYIYFYSKVFVKMWYYYYYVFHITITDNYVVPTEQLAVNSVIVLQNVADDLSLIVIGRRFSRTPSKCFEAIDGDLGGNVEELSFTNLGV